jgi:hypothetical protein
MTIVDMPVRQMRAVHMLADNMAKEQAQEPEQAQEHSA